MKKSGKRVAVLFSSGLDSTYLVYKNLKAGNTVYPYYVSIDNNVNKIQIEKQKIVLQFEKFREEFGDLMKEPKMLLNVMIHQCWNDLSFHQLPIWLFSLQFMDTLDLDEIHMGYVSNDDALSYLDDIQRAYAGQQWLFKNVRKTKLLFPIKKMKKEQMMKELSFTPYVKHIYSCENPTLLDEKEKVEKEHTWGWKKDFIGKYVMKYKNCGNCVPCERILKNEELRRFYINHVSSEFEELYSKMIETEFRYYNGDGSKIIEDKDETVYKKEYAVKPAGVEYVTIDVTLTPEPIGKSVSKIERHGDAESKLEEIDVAGVEKHSKDLVTKADELIDKKVERQKAIQSIGKRKDDQEFVDKQEFCKTTSKMVSDFNDSEAINTKA